MGPKASVRTSRWRTLAFALALAQGCGEASAERAEESSHDSAGRLTDVGDAEAAAEGQSEAEQEGTMGCIFEVDALLAQVGVETAPRINCGAFRAGATAAGGDGVVACFSQQSGEKQSAAEFRFTTGGIDSGPVTYFIGDGAGGLWSVVIHRDTFASSGSDASTVESCASLDVAGSGVVYCVGAKTLYRCSAAR